MPRIKTEHADEQTFIRFRDRLSVGGVLPDWAKQVSQESLEDESRPIFGGPAELELIEIRQQADVQVDVHAHDEDEIIYVVAGSLLLGQREFPTGSAILVPAQTLYGYRTGPQGLRFLNFRARASERPYITREEFLRERDPEPDVGP